MCPVEQTASPSRRHTPCMLWRRACAPHAHGVRVGLVAHVVVLRRRDSHRTTALVVYKQPARLDLRSTEPNAPRTVVFRRLRRRRGATRRACCGDAHVHPKRTATQPQLKGAPCRQCRCRRHCCPICPIRQWQTIGPACGAEVRCLAGSCVLSGCRPRPRVPPPQVQSAYRRHEGRQHHHHHPDQAVSADRPRAAHAQQLSRSAA